MVFEYNVIISLISVILIVVFKNINKFLISLNYVGLMMFWFFKYIVVNYVVFLKLCVFVYIVIS